MQTWSRYRICDGIWDFKNGTIGCLDKIYTGDDFCHCLGCTDDKKRPAEFKGNNRFRCQNGTDIPPTALWDQLRDCSENEDELVCPWAINRTNGWHSAYCCQSVAEDQWLCELKWKSEYTLFDYIQNHPQIKVKTLFENNSILKVLNTVTFFTFNQACLYYEHLLHQRSTKQSLYLTYPHPPPKSQGH
ncbi:unnamed protein product [Adineta ricciae]|uniref:Uncharacterized protein n=1 Tax=Adineta ricciae TaxID=249248 RepID=A0A815VE35_ADIRI|nr:unnamed protein product [Adineta ricciae]CAF1531748.1 unnamed protein product [Adineta ricciae]